MKVSFSLAISALLPLLAISATACSGEDAQQAVPPGPAAAFHGTWGKGEYKKLDEEGLALKQTSVHATFNAKDEMDGEFTLSFPNEDNSSTKGNYRVFNMTRLILDIEESNFSDFGLDGSIRTVGFEMSRSDLLLEGDDFEIILVKTKDSISNDKNSPAPDQRTIKGNWSCIDRARNAWALSIEDSFFNVSVTGSGNTYFHMNGNVMGTNASFSQASLLISNSSYTAYVGRQLNVSSTGSGLQVIMTADDQQLDQFSCKEI